eukprot:1160172-Pelagomonas_calceolata.AAC.3
MQARASHALSRSLWSTLRTKLAPNLAARLLACKLSSPGHNKRCLPASCASLMYVSTACLQCYAFP